MAHENVEPVVCKKCGKLPRWRLRGYSTMVFCQNKCCSVMKASFQAAVLAWNKANQETPLPTSPKNGEEELNV